MPNSKQRAETQHRAKPLISALHFLQSRKALAVIAVIAVI